MGRLFNLFVDICLLRAGLQDLPGSGFLLLTVLLSPADRHPGYCGNFRYAGRCPGCTDAGHTVAAWIAKVVASAYRKVGQVSANGFRTVWIRCIDQPGHHASAAVHSGDPSGPALGEMGTLFYLIIIVWALVIVGHIIRHALEIRLAAGIMLSLGYFLIANYIIQTLFTAA